MKNGEKGEGYCVHVFPVYELNVVCCVGRVKIPIKIWKVSSNADTDGKELRFERWPFVREKQEKN